MKLEKTFGKEDILLRKKTNATPICEVAFWYIIYSWLDGVGSFSSL